MPLTQAFAIAGLAALYTGYALATQCFRRTRSPRGGMNLLIVSGVATALIQGFTVLLSPPPALWQVVVGLALAACAVVLFLWALSIHEDDKPTFALLDPRPTSLRTSGPYTVIRHPIYASYLIGWCAAPVIAGNAWLLLPMLWNASLYFLAARNEERSFATTPFAVGYAEYRRRTGMFLPRLW